MALAVTCALVGPYARLRVPGSRHPDARAAEAVLRSGGALPEALRRAVEASDDQLARQPFAEALRAFDLGAPLDEALRSAAAVTRDRRARMALETLAIGVALRLPGDRAGLVAAAYL